MRIVLFFCFVCVGMGLHAQQKSDTLDLNEAVKQIMGSKDPEKQGSGTSILPAIGYNPTFGLMLGATLTGGKTLGNPATTTLSTGTFTGFITTKGIINVQLRHNVFTENNTWNFQGNAQISKMVLLDYGLGTYAGQGYREGLSINQYTLDNNEAVYPIKFNYIRIFEKVYKKISKTLMVGDGVALDNHFCISDSK